MEVIISYDTGTSSITYKLTTWHQIWTIQNVLMNCGNHSKTIIITMSLMMSDLGTWLSHKETANALSKQIIDIGRSRNA
ncbi:unnamed protein product [Absidia cylindrospora]